jgi:hypothetical protein
LNTQKLAIKNGPKIKEMSLASLGKRGFFTFHQVKLLDSSLIKAITSELKVKTGKYLLKTNLSTFTIDSQGSKSAAKSINFPFIMYPTPAVTKM